MFRSTRLIMAICIGSTALAGCASSNVAGQGAAHAVCDRCGVAETHSYTVPGYEGPRPMGYLTSKTPECSSCQAAQENYNATGQFEPACKNCGGTMKMAESK